MYGGIRSVAVWHHVALIVTVSPFAGGGASRLTAEQAYAQAVLCPLFTHLLAHLKGRSRIRAVLFQTITKRALFGINVTRDTAPPCKPDGSCKQQPRNQGAPACSSRTTNPKPHGMPRRA